MKMIYFQGKQPNFGDELNTWLWPQILPNFFDDDDSTVFLGIGSSIGKHFAYDYDAAKKKIVFGAGYVPEYLEKPDVNQGDWDIFFVRGPRTAQQLNISPDLAIGDSAILLRTVMDDRRRIPEVVSFMPHWESIDAGNWEHVCELAGVNLIDPRRPPNEVIAELLRSRLVITEAMHGAIVADALRVPWVPVLPINAMHRNKWFDWADALGITLQQHRLWPSSFTELKLQLYPPLYASVRNKWFDWADAFSITLQRHRLWPSNLTELTLSVHPSRYAGVNESRGGRACRLLEMASCHLSADRLVKMMKNSGNLSTDSTIDYATNKMLEKVEQLRRKYS